MTETINRCEGFDFFRGLCRQSARRRFELRRATNVWVGQSEALFHTSILCACVFSLSKCAAAGIA